jgi:hypothetical protein
MKNTAVVVAFLACTAAAFAQPEPVAQIQQSIANRLHTQSPGDVHEEACGSFVTVSCGTNRNASLGSCLSQNYYIDLYQISATAGQKLQITASNTTNQYMALVITDAAANVVASDYDIPSITINYTPPTGGTYYIGVSFVSTFTSGPYNLTITCSSSTPAPSQCFYTGTMSVGQSVTAQLVSDDAVCWSGGTRNAKAYKVSANAGDTFEVDYSSNFAPYVEIKGPDASGAFRGAASGPISTYYIVPASGSVTIYATSNTTSPVTGTFTLSLVPFSQPPCGKARAVRH